MKKKVPTIIKTARINIKNYLFQENMEIIIKFKKKRKSLVI